MSAAAKVLARCADYNGHKDVLFMMKTDDYRLGDGNYEKVADAEYDHRARLLRADGRTYRVFSDWSLRVVDA